MKGDYRSRGSKWLCNTPLSFPASSYLYFIHCWWTPKGSPKGQVWNKRGVNTHKHTHRDRARKGNCMPLKAVPLWLIFLVVWKNVSWQNEKFSRGPLQNQTKPNQEIILDFLSSTFHWTVGGHPARKDCHGGKTSRWAANERNLHPKHPSAVAKPMAFPIPRRCINPTAWSQKTDTKKMTDERGHELIREIPKDLGSNPALGPSQTTRQKWRKYYKESQFCRIVLQPAETCWAFLGKRGRQEAHIRFSTNNWQVSKGFGCHGGKARKW